MWRANGNSDFNQVIYYSLLLIYEYKVVFLGKVFTHHEWLPRRQKRGAGHKFCGILFLVAAQIKK
jgi:hypothetical protein